MSTSILAQHASPLLTRIWRCPYEPKDGSLAHRVIAFFESNPDEQLSRRDIAIKFNVNQSTVINGLERAVDNDLLARRWIEGGVRVYCAGSALTIENDLAEVAE